MGSQTWFTKTKVAKRGPLDTHSRLEAGSGPRSSSSEDPVRAVGPGVWGSTGNTARLSALTKCSAGQQLMEECKAAVSMTPPTDFSSFGPSSGLTRLLTRPACVGQRPPPLCEI